MNAPARPTTLRIRHTMLRVADLDRSLAFYTGRLGMHVMRLRDNPHERAAYIGYGDEKTDHALELIQERNRTDPIGIGNGFGHIALAVPDIAAMCERLKREGVTFAQDLMPAPSGALRIAFIRDPDGYEIELTERL